MSTDLVSATASALVSLHHDRGRAMARGEDWMEKLKRELIDALGLVYRVDWAEARRNVEAELAEADDPLGLLEELVLRHRLAVAMYHTDEMAVAIAHAG